ncbi:hypothetical protein QN277_002270 [Acacia crassicarpa]|uniref:Vacuolar protein sorting-associated protein 62 n=1 Tax=Acacia crassicarpa TaxID=499986 RepID=A0AAE1TJE4_9FABA|nr:hypothetical protein QN277_002270 [Acacia crassicarpa]
MIRLVQFVFVALLFASLQMALLEAAPVERFSLRGLFKKKRPPPPAIQTTFKLPAAPPVWPPGKGFATGIIDLGGLQVSQVSTFNKIWTTLEGGPDNAGATFFEPTGIPQGFSMLGFYSQPNNKPLFGWVLVAKDNSPPSNASLKAPVDYKLIWSSNSLQIKQNGPGYVWLPVAPDGYKAVGHLVTTSPEKPSLDRIRCVRSDLTDQPETYSWIWGPGKNYDANGLNVYDARPSNRGTQAQGVRAGTFIVQNGGTTTPLSIACLKNTNANPISMPNLHQIEALVQAYSPVMYLHPDEQYLPSSVDWYFTNGALLYKKGEESKPVPVQPNGTNLPQDPNNDGAYWLDLPADQTNKERVKKGNLESFHAYVHVKPMLGGTFTDLALWIFYPFNGPARAKVEFLNVPLGKIGEHVGDWEHVTLRISNFNGQLYQIYFSEHSGGTWVDASQLEYQNGNKPVAYSSLHGHAMYAKSGLVLQGSSAIGIRNDTDKSNMVADLGSRFEVVSAEYLGPGVVAEPPWLNYFRQWGPKVTYNTEEEIKKAEKLLPGKLKAAFEKIVRGLPNEVFGEEGPTGPKVKRSWNGDEA